MIRNISMSDCISKTAGEYVKVPAGHHAILSVTVEVFTDGLYAI
jgi:hypothetical protein